MLPVGIAAPFLYLLTKPKLTSPVQIPSKYSRPGYYPTSYSVRYDNHNKAYVLALGGLKHWGAK